MIASEEEEVLWVFDLVGEHEADGLDGLFAAVDVIAQKEVVGLSGEAGVLEELDEVGELSVDVACVEGGLPQILMGASSSSSMGCSRKISRALTHRPRISDSSSFTSFPPFSCSREIILSTSTFYSTIIEQTIYLNSTTIPLSLFTSEVQLGLGMGVGGDKGIGGQVMEGSFISPGVLLVEWAADSLVAFFYTL